MFSRVILEPWVNPWRHWFTASGLVMVRNGRFQVHGLDPDTEVPIYFLDPGTGSAPRSTSRASPRPAGQSPSGSSPAARPRPGWLTPAASRSRDYAR